jgi:hypothetical protein
MTSNLAARVNGAKAVVRNVRGPADGLMLMVVLDVTGDLSLVEPARRSLMEALAVQRPASIYTALLRAQDGLRVLLDPTADQAKLAEVLEAQTVSGRAGLLNTVEAAIELADGVAGRSGARVAILYLTDSTIANYREDYTNPVVNSSDARDLSRRFPEGLVKERMAQLQSSLGSRQTPLFLVHLEFRNDRLNEAYQTGLLELASLTGGAAVICRTVTEIPEAIHSMVEEMYRQHTVRVEAAGRRKGPLLVELEMPEGTVRHRSRFLLK